MSNEVQFNDLSLAHQIAAYVRTGWRPNRSIDTRFYEDPRRGVTFCPTSGGCCRRTDPSQPMSNVFGGVQADQTSMFGTIDEIKCLGPPENTPWQPLCTPERRPNLPKAFETGAADDWPFSAPGTIVGLMTRVPGRGYQK